jgi:two-component system response regulator HydG
VTEFYQKTELLKEVPSEKKGKSISDNERDYIISTLKSCNWKIYGPGGAAELLEIHVSTLNSKIKKLGIKKEWQLE